MIFQVSTLFAVHPSQSQMWEIRPRNVVNTAVCPSSNWRQMVSNPTGISPTARRLAAAPSRIRSKKYITVSIPTRKAFESLIDLLS